MGGVADTVASATGGGSVDVPCSVSNWSHSLWVLQLVTCVRHSTGVQGSHRSLRRRAPGSEVRGMGPDCQYGRKDEPQTETLGAMARPSPGRGDGSQDSGGGREKEGCGYDCGKEAFISSSELFRHPGNVTMLTQAVQELTEEVAKAREERAESSETRRKSRAVEKGNE